MKSLTSIVLAALLLGPVLAGSSNAQTPTTGTRPKLLVLPWLAVGRNTNRECSRGEINAAPTREAQRLAQSAQSALDGQMHRMEVVEMIPRKAWEAKWRERPASEFFLAASGCAVCTPVGQLIKFDAAALQQIARHCYADYVWLGVTVAALTPERSSPKPDPCCKETLGQERRAVLARSSVVLVRVSDGEMVWQRDARRLDADVPHKVRKMPRTQQTRRRMAVEDTARALGTAFRRDGLEALR